MPKGRFTFYLMLIVFVSAFQVSSYASVVDTLLPADIEYVGYRVFVRNVSVVKQKGKNYLLNLEVVNTGKRSISFGPGFPERYLQTRFDNSLKLGGLLPLGLQIRESLIDSEFELAVGNWKKDIQIWVSANKKVKRKKLKKDDFEIVENRILRSKTKNKQTIESLDSNLIDGTIDCVDLKITDFTVINKTRREASLKIEISNVGTQRWLDIESAKGLSMFLFLSGSDQLTNSSKRIAKLKLSNRILSKNKKSLSPGESVVLVERIDIKNATRYTNTIIVQLDSGQVVQECDETNNEAALLLSK